MDQERKYFPITEMKATGDRWEVAGYASTFGGEPDSYGDVVVKGAFLESIAKRKTKHLWQHDEPIGKELSLVEDDHGLFGRWSIIPTDTGKKAHQLIAEGLIDSLSIGFLPIETDYREDGVRLLKKVDLIEVSSVTFPANTNALITSFKSDLPFHMLLKQVQDAIALAAGEAKALAERRAADGRSLNDRHIAAIEALLPEAKALLAALDGLRVVPPDAEARAAEMDLLRLRARLHRARARRTA